MHQDTFYKTVRVFGTIVEKDLILKFKPNTVARTDGTTITLGCGENPGYLDYATLKHELAHIVGKSSFTLLKKFISARKQYAQLAKLVFNVLEDKRVDGIWMALYRGYVLEVAEKADNIIRNNVQNGLFNSLIVVRYGRSDLVAPVWQAYIPVMEEAFEQVAETTPEGTYRVACWLWDKLIAQIREQVRKAKQKVREKQEKQGQQKGQAQAGEPRPGSMGGGGASTDSTAEPSNEGQGGGVLDPGEEENKKDEKEKSGDTGNKDKPEDKGDKGEKDDKGEKKDAQSDGNGDKKSKDNYPEDWAVEDEIEALEELERQIREDGKDLAERDQASNEGSTWGPNPSDAYLIDLNLPLPEALRESKRRARAQIAKIREQLFKPEPRDPVKSVKGNVRMYDLSDYGLSCADSLMANKLRRYLMKVRGRTGQVYEDSGDALDLDEFIQWKIRPRAEPEFFTEQKPNQPGFAITILVDCSSSMNRNKKLIHARATAATLMEALESISRIDLTVVGWYGMARQGRIRSGNESGLGVTLQVAKKKEQIVAMTARGNTPTHLPLQWATEDMKLKNAKKKLIIMLTDGEPSCQKGDGTGRMPAESVCQAGHKAVQDARRAGIQYYGILITAAPNPATSEVMRRIFGAKSYDVLPPEKGLQKLEDVIIHNLVRELQKR